MTPSVSVLIPTYNRARFLPDAIRSVLGQTWTDLEVIVIDDGSTDDTATAVRTIADARVHYIRQPHGGLGHALNAGLRAARGHYIARLDSDDLWLPNMLEHEVAVLEANPHLDVVYARGQGMNVNALPLANVWGVPLAFPNDALRSMLYGDSTCVITIVARRHCFDSVGLYDESLPLGEDWDMCLRLARRHRFAFLDEITARFRRHDDNITGACSRVDPYARVRVLDKAFSDPTLPVSLRTMKPVCYRNVYAAIGTVYLEQRRLLAAFTAFGHAVRSGENAFATVGYIGWLVVSWLLLSRSRPGRCLVAWLTSHVSRGRGWMAARRTA